VTLAALLASSVTAATRNREPPPDREMLQMMEMLREMELIKQLDMVRDLHHLESAVRETPTGPAQKSAAGKKKELAK
jgi:hypothetical protein